MRLLLSIVNLVWHWFQSRQKASDFYASWRYTQKILNQFHQNSCVIHTKFIMFLTLFFDFDFLNVFLIMFLMTLMAFRPFFCNVFWRNIVHHLYFICLYISQPQNVLNLFLFFDQFQPRCSYKVCSYKKKCRQSSNFSFFNSLNLALSAR